MLLAIDSLKHAQHILFLTTFHRLDNGQLNCRLKVQKHFVSFEFLFFIEDEHDEAGKNHALDEVNCILDHSFDIFTESHI